MRELALIFFIVASSLLESKTPNILIILADDLGWNDVSYHGSEIPTPNIDKIISSGIELDRFYVQPTCSPTRAELMTGKSALRLGITRPISKNQKLGLDLDEKLLSEYLKELQYENFLLGKWHLGAYTPDYFPTRRGFDYFLGYLQGGIGYYDHNHGGGHDWQENESELRQDGYATHLIRDAALDIIENHSGANPLFLNINFGAPHTPNEAPQQSIEKFTFIKDSKRQIHAAMVYEMDNAIGNIIDALEKENLLENTIIFFASDNGGLIPDFEVEPSFLALPKNLGICDWERPLSVKVVEWICSSFDGASSNAPLQEGKMAVGEGGIRVTAAIWWPNHLETKRNTNFISMMDILPTLLELVGYKGNQENFDGVSKVPSFKNNIKVPSTYVVTDVANNSYAFLEMPYKLVKHGSEIQLFNVMQDPTESNNIAHENPLLLESMETQLALWPMGENRSEPLPKVLRDPDLFGGEEDRISWIEQANINAQQN